MVRNWLAAVAGTLSLALPATASAVASAELYQNQTFTYGRFEARTRFAPGEGVISSFFLWKPGSEMPGTFWNELDFEKLGANCRLQTNPLYGAPVADHGQIATVAGDLCNEYHTYTFEWTPEYIAWLVDGVEVRREAGETAAAFAANAGSGMQMHFNIWPGDASFGGTFDPAILPVQQYISWVQYSSFADGAFTLAWREDFTSGALPSGWATGTWASPKSLSTHSPTNVGFVGASAVLSLTSDGALGFNGQPPPDNDSAAGDAGSAGMPGSAGNGPAAGGTSGSPGSGASSGGASSGGASGTGASSGGTSSGGAQATPGVAGAGTSNVPFGDGPASPDRRHRDDSGCGIARVSPPTPALAAWMLGIAAGVATRLRRKGLRRMRSE
jgi:hypothetical protein